MKPSFPLALLTIASFAVTGAAQETGVLQEIWFELPGDSVSDLTQSPKYNQVADAVKVLAAFEAEATGEAFGSRYTALVTPPATGEYTFWIASDDGSELRLSPTEDPAGAKPLAAVNGWTGKQEWEKQPGQKSAPVRLEKGKRYALQALHKEVGGVDHLSVAWEGPNLPRQVIAGQYLQLPSLSAALKAKIDATRRAEAEQKRHVAEAAEYWRKGVTLPVEVTAQFTVSSEGPPPNDTGINVLLDQAHQTSFAVLWGLRGKLRQRGFRVCTSEASLDSVLTPGKPSRIRARVGDMEPFAWWPTAEFNVVLLEQHDFNAQAYTPAEQAALQRFIESGGGVVVFGARPTDGNAAAAWSLNEFVSRFGAKYTSRGEQRDGKTYPSLSLDENWETLLAGEGKQPLRARRTVGQGRLVLVEGIGALNPGKGDAEPVAKAKLEALAGLMTWAAGGKAPVGGEGRLPHFGGVGLFPEKEKNLGGVVVYYAANQKPEVLECLEKNIPAAAQQIRAWLPNKEFEEPYNLVICAGGGGGWALGARPKAAAVISYDPLNLLGIFAHEMAHTMGGPRNANGELAGRSPHHNQGEAHAGWFQGKILALYDESARSNANRNCNSILELERKKGAKLDLALELETPAGREKWGKGPEWTKLWWIWQKLDDRFGPTWYPRWYWVRATRWAAEPGHTETWDEMVEDMSLAVGEDLFPFFRSVGTTLSRDRLEQIEFQGKTLRLPVCPLDTGPAGNVCLDPVGDYTKPLKPRR